MRFEVESPRLFARPWRPGDRPVFMQRFVQDPDMMLYINHGKAWDDAKVDAYFERQRRFLGELGCGVGAVVLKESGLVVGGAGIQPQDRSGDYELAWSIWKEHWNKGYATEIASALKDHAFRTMKLKRIVAVADVPNLASIRIMQKIGMRYDAVVNAHDLVERYPEVDVVRYVLDNPLILGNA
ncbi:MAG TPA: GNAT family N-acetyltransferase [Gammaproteobacteria bacterium]|nr:GNAT family N-acetyltransferase [Gammaproteobacteria bacterium]